MGLERACRGLFFALRLYDGRSEPRAHLKLNWRAVLGCTTEGPNPIPDNIPDFPRTPRNRGARTELSR